MAQPPPVPEELVLRPAGVSDVPELLRLAEEIWRVHYSAILSQAQIEYMLGWMYAEETIRREIAKGLFWELAQLGVENVGYLSCELEQEKAELKLHKLYLLPSLHGHGFGQKMLRHVKGKAAQLGARRIRLNVNKQNQKAIHAYQKSGFRVDRAVVNDIGQGFVMDDYEMVFDLK